MELLLLLLPAVLARHYHNIDKIKKDNSNYVEGISRYIWMPDGNNIPRLQPLSPSGSKEKPGEVGRNEYRLFTRDNPKQYQLLIHGDVSSVTRSHFRPTLPTIIITHGWHSEGNTSWIVGMKDAILKKIDANVIIVDWGKTSNNVYYKAAHLVPAVGRKLGDFLMWLIGRFGGNWNNVHLIGHSLGAHVVGAAGRAAGSRPARISGLDPAGPLWAGNPNALARDSAVYVESIHTDGGVLGLIDPISHVDFYPNGGKNPQPGCRVSICSHTRATELFADTIRSNQLTALKCNNLNQAISSRCKGINKLNMGNIRMDKTGSGIYHLKTKDKPPFLSNNVVTYLFTM